MTAKDLFPELKRDAQGLVTVIAQDRRSGEVRMLAHADEAALRATLSTGFAHFFSRSRQRGWKKGEESGNVLRVFEVWIDCDADAVLYLVEPAGPSCHTGAPSCFFRRVSPAEEPGAGSRALPALPLLEAALQARRDAPADRSYTRSLLDKGPAKIAAKLTEEAGELGDAIADESDARVVSEAADVIYHLMVGLLSRGVPLAAVESELLRRFGVSGHVEKAQRSQE
ncbi:MAG: bifunctional phosphoribosyl-AMP cyclohydrolase/phosphoribosyl-ATP diphosphatase HisIE [Sandaracinaceae bacterium]